MNRVKKINYVYLITVLVIMFSGTGIIPFHKFVKSGAGILIVSQVIIVLPSLIYLLINRINYKEAVRFKKVRPANVVLLIVFTFLLLPVMTFINALSQLYAVDTTSGTMSGVTSESPFLIAIIAIAFIPCVFEETVYRGIFFNEYSKHSKIGAIFLSAFLFGILHGNFNQFTYAFVMGIVFAFVIEATDSIISTMIIHFIINGNSVVLLYLYPKMISYLESMYHNAVASGDETMIATLENIVGGNNFNANEILDSAATAISNNTLGTVIASYGMFALVGGVLAFFVYRTIAMNANRWDHVKAIFKRNAKENDKRNPEDYYSRKTDDYYMEDKQTRLFSKENFTYFLPLYIGIALCIVGMILNEIYVRAII